MSLELAGVTHTIDGTEYSLLADANYSAGSARTTKGYLDVVIDPSALAAGDRLQIAAYEKVNNGTQRSIFTRVIEGPCTEAFVLRDLLVGEAYDVTAKKLAGTSRAIRASRRLFAPANPAFSPGSATIGATRFSLPNASTVLTPQTTDRRLQVWLDLANLAAGDEYLLILWDGANGGTAIPLYRARLRGKRGALFYTPTLLVGEAWDVTLEKVSGTDRSIGWSLRTDDGATTASPPSFPVLATATTAESIRDRAIDVIEALVPELLPGDRFVRYRNEGGADFQKWAEEHPAGQQRRFQVRDDGSDEPPPVSNTDVEERRVKFVVTVAYPQAHRAGPDNALDRDDVMSADQHQIENAIGMRGGRANFSPPYPDACWLEGSTERVVGDACDFLVIKQTMIFRRSMA